MSEEIVNNLFAQARNEVPETSSSDILKWIGGVTLLMMLAAYLAKFKILFISKPLVMISSIITVAGISVGTIALLPSSENNAAPKSFAGSAIVKENKHEILVSSDSVVETKPEIKKDTATFSLAEVLNENPSSSPLLPLLASMNFNAQFCGPSQPLAINRDEEGIGEFHAIEVTGVADVVLIQEEKSGVRIEEENSDSDKIKIKNVNGVLKIDRRPDSHRQARVSKVTFYVSVRSLDKITCTDATNISTRGAIEADAISIDAEGASRVNVNLSVKELNIKANGAADVILTFTSDKLTIDMGGASKVVPTGETANLIVESSGASDLKASNLKAANVTVTASGASHLKLQVSENLDVSADGASNVKYKGSPKMGKITVAEAAHLGRL